LDELKTRSIQGQVKQKAKKFAKLELIEYLKTTPVLILKELDNILNDPCESFEEYHLR
jgi:hypothetical protein